MRGTELACLSEKPRLTVRVEQGAKRGNFLPSKIILSRTYTGHPQMCTSISFLCSHLVFLKRSKEESPVRGSGMWFTRNRSSLVLPRR